MPNKSVWPLLAMLFTVVLWGLSYLSIKVAVAVVPPMTLAFIRFLLALLPLFFILRWLEPETKLKKADYPLMALAGVLGVTIYFYFENNGVKLINASAASLIIATIPIFTLVADAIVFGTTLSRRKIFSVIISLGGVYLIVGGNLLQLFMSGSGKGYLLMFGASLSWVVYSLATKPLGKKYSQLAIVFYQTVFGTIALLPFALLEKTNWQMVDATIIWNIIYLSLFCSALGYFMYVYALGHLGVDVSSLYINLIPVVAVVASVFLLHERLYLHQVIGGFLVIIAVYLANYQFKAKATIEKIYNEQKV